MQLCQRDLNDPRVGFATITRVETSRDLGLARVWVSVYGTDADRAASIEALSSMPRHGCAAGSGERLHLRHVPQLEFRADDSIESGDRVLRILRDIEADDRHQGRLMKEVVDAAPRGAAGHGHLPREPGRGHAGRGHRHRHRRGTNGQGRPRS